MTPFKQCPWRDRSLFASLCLEDDTKEAPRRLADDKQTNGRGKRDKLWSGRWGGVGRGRGRVLDGEGGREVLQSMLTSSQRS